MVRRSIIAAAMKGCTGHGTCSRTHRPHQHLQGIQPSMGRFYTIVAEPYPRALCRRLVGAFALSIDRRYQSHPFHDIWTGVFRRANRENIKSCSGGEGNALPPHRLKEKRKSGSVGEGNALPTRPVACAASPALRLHSLNRKCESSGA